jgi:small ligand-binding sensory domain FIST
MKFAAALSEHPLATQAVGETVGSILEQLDGPPDLVALFATDAHTGMMEDITRAARSLLNPRVLVGSTASSILGGAQEVEGSPGLAIFAAQLGVEIEPVRLEAFGGPDGEVLVAGGQSLNRGEGTLILLADPYSFPVAEVVDQLSDAVPDLRVIGGMASAARQAYGNVLALDDERFGDGAVGVMLPPEVPLTSVVSQGCRPIGQPLVVTRAERNVIYELAGQPALERLMSQISELDAETRTKAARGLHIGLVIDEQKPEFGAGDFLIRGVLGADRTAGAVAIGDEVDVGTTVQFQIRDAESADADLRTMMTGVTAEAALVFTCNGRGTQLFGAPNHDAALLSDHLSSRPIAGMFCAGEVGPVGGRTMVHGFTASVALFG